jgi:hypothetical protein
MHAGMGSTKRKGGGNKLQGKPQNIHEHITQDFINSRPHDGRNKAWIIPVA